MVNQHSNIYKLAAFIGTLPDKQKLEKQLMEYIANSPKISEQPRKTA